MKVVRGTTDANFEERKMKSYPEKGKGSVGLGNCRCRPSPVETYAGQCEAEKRGPALALFPD